MVGWLGMISLMLNSLVSDANGLRPVCVQDTVRCSDWKPYFKTPQCT
jgi:hypothetical protein